MKELIRKYNVPGPRYTSYPSVPHWDVDHFHAGMWPIHVREAYQEGSDQGISLYIHLPYCESLCTFCGCHKHITKQHSVERPYLETVLKEWKLYLQLFPERPLIKEIHLGGGTPTFFSAENLKRLIQGIAEHSVLHESAELGFEGHPNNTTREHLEALAELGFKRVSFGVQDYAPVVQETIRRIQPFENVQRVHEMAKELGYDSIGHDLVFGLPKQKLEHIKETVRLTNLLRPDRISLYSYAHVPWVKGVGQRGYDESDLPKDEEKRELYETAKEMLLESGYHEIGMDHFALETDSLYKAFQERSLHRNFMGYTTNTTQLMIGLGMSAISDSWTSFAQNVKTVKEYTELVNKGVIPVFRGHELTPQDLEIRSHILNLMCSFQTRWDHYFVVSNVYAEIIDCLHPLELDGLIEMDDFGLHVTEKGKPFIRNICMCFDLNLRARGQKENQFSKTI